MDCFQDFCLACDGESLNGAYCSQACKLADLEKASAPASPTSATAPPTSTSNRSSWVSSSSGNRSDYVLAPAYKFPDRTSGYSQPTRDDKRPSSTYFMRSPAEQSTPSSQKQRSLTPSSSRSSLSSTNSSSNSPMSEQAKQELQEFFNSFNSSKPKRRQSTW